MTPPPRWLFVATVAALSAARVAAQATPTVSIRAGVAVSNRYGNTAREAGPDLGVGLVFGGSHRVAIEVSGSASIFGSSLAQPVCIPDGGGCSTHVSGPGAVLGVGLNAVVGAGGRLGVFAGAGFSASTSFPEEPTVQHRNAWSVQGGLRLRPLAGAVRGLGLELRATRFSRAIAEVRTVLASSLSWTF